MWVFFNHIRAFIISVAFISNLVQKNDKNKETNNETNINNVTEVTTVNNSFVEHDLKLRNKKYRDFILRNTTKAIDGHIYILGLFELTTKYGTRMDGFSEIGAAQLAIEHINTMDYVRGYRLKLLINDTTCDPGAGIDRYFHALYSKQVITMLLGTACSNVTESLASIVPYWNILQVSFGSSSPVLSDRRKFPLFFRTVAPDSSQNDARLALIKHFGWNTVATFSQRENTYMLPLNSLVAQLEASHIDCSTSVTFSMENYKEQLKYLKQSDVRIVVASISPTLMETIFCEIYNLKMYGSDYVWLLRENRFNLVNVTLCQPLHVRKALEGIITVAHHQFMPYDQKSIAGFANKDFAKLLNNTEFSKFTYDAVWTMAVLLRRLQDVRALNLSDFYYDQDEFVEHMIDEMKDLRFMGASGAVSFRGADRIGDTIVKQIQNGIQRVVAYYNATTKRLTFKCDECVRIKWQHDVIPIAKRILQVRLDTIPKYAFFAICIYSLLGLTGCILFFYFNFHYRSIKVVKLSSPRLNNIAVLGCSLVFVAVILLGVDSSTIFNASYFSQPCTTRVFLLSAGISLAFGSTFAKTYRVHRIFTYSCATKDKLLKDLRLIILVFVLVAIDGVVLTFWVYIDPLQRRLHNLTIEISSTDRSVLYQPQIEVCRCRNTTGWFLAMYGYKGFLLIMGVYMAWETRHIKVEALNDSQHIGVCVYSAVFSSLLVLLSNFLTEYTLVAYLTQTISILASTTLTLLLLFVPKLKAVFWDGQQEPIMPGLKIESKTRRLEVEDPNELTYRMLVQNKVYRCELEALDKEIARLEGLLATDRKSERTSSARASWPCVQIYNVSSRFLSQQSRLNQDDDDVSLGDREVNDTGDGKFFGKMLRGILGRLYHDNRISDDDEDENKVMDDTFDACASESNYSLRSHKFYIDIEEHI